MVEVDFFKKNTFCHVSCNAFLLAMMAFPRTLLVQINKSDSELKKKESD